MTEATLTTGSIDSTAIEKLRIDFGGDILRQSDQGFDEARHVYNGMFSERRPAVILRCRTTDDVVSAVNFCRDNGLLVAVKGGGHSIPGFSAVEGGVLIDLSQMNSVDVDPQSRIAKAGGGTTWAQFDAATQEHGLATPGGFVSTTGIAGLTLNGGIGYLSRKHGLSCDNLIGAEVVTSSGEIVEVSENDNAELLWGLRGGGGNFGIVTRFEFKLHPVTDVYLRVAMYDADKGKEVLKAYRDAAPSAPEGVVSAALFYTVPVDPMMPEELHGKMVWAIFAGCIGPESEGEPLTEFAIAVDGPLAAFGMTVPYTFAQQFQDEASKWGHQNYWKSGLLDVVSDEVIDKIAELAPTASSPLCQLNVLALGGAIAEVAEDATAYSNRTAVFNFSIDNIWEDSAENDKQIAWSRAFFEQIRPAMRGVYLNFIGDEGLDRVKESFGAKYERLVELKKKYDPINLFRLNQNIKPE
ncbi:MAG: FAD-binding oxidoreductase [Actinomycetota bacterium]